MSDEGWLVEESMTMVDKEIEEQVRLDTVVRDEVLKKLRLIIDPDIGKDIVECNFIKDLKIDHNVGKVEFTLELTTMACPVKDQFSDLAEKYLLELDEVNEVDINITARKSTITAEYAGHENAQEHLLGVSGIVAFSSGKGGVGKSSLCINTAFMLSNMGAKVGIVDCDVYGPSLPTMIPVPNPQVYFSNTKEQIDRRMKKKQMEGDDGKSKSDKAFMNEMLQSGEGAMLPIEYKGVKMMSYGYLRPGANKYSGVRGPLASSLVYQMVTQTQWGELDYLLLDLPPGTGDIHLTVGQAVPITGAVCVTTTSPLAISDVLKGLHMFSAIAIPPIAVVENMAYLPCPACDHKIPLDPIDYGQSQDEDELEQLHLDNVINQFGIQVHIKVPMDREMQRMTKSNGTIGSKIAPYVNFADENAPAMLALKELCKGLIMEIAKTKYAENNTPSLGQTADGKIYMSFKSKDGQHENLYLVQCREVRLRCRCAECVDEFTGRVKINPRLIPKLTYTTNIKKTGNYATTFTWQDGHTSILSFSSLEAMAKQLNAQINSEGSTCTVTNDSDW